MQLAIQPGGHLAIVCNAPEHTRSDYFVKQGPVMPPQPRGSPGSRDIMFYFSVQATTIAPVGNTGWPIDRRKTYSTVYTACAFTSESSHYLEHSVHSGSDSPKYGQRTHSPHTLAGNASELASQNPPPPQVSAKDLGSPTAH